MKHAHSRPEDPASDLEFSRNLAALRRCNTLLFAGALALLVAAGGSAFSLETQSDVRASAYSAHEAAIEHWDSVLSKDPYFDAHDEPEETEEPSSVRCDQRSCFDV